MTNATPAVGGDVLRMPYEGTETTVDAAANSLFESLASDPDFQEDTPDPDEETPESDEDLDEEPESEDETEESDESDDEEPDDDEPEAPKTSLDDSTELEIDGEKVTLAELKKDRLRQADYTRKTMALAEERKTFQAEVESTRAERERYASTLQSLEQYLESTKPAVPDWATLRRENPAEYAAQWAEHQQREQDLAAVQAERQKLEAKAREEREAEIQTYLEEQKTKLVAAIPEWNDPEKSTALKESLVKGGAREYGFTEEDFGNVTDHRLILMLRDALKYRELSTKGIEKVAEAKQATKVLRPGSRDTAPRVGAKKEVRALSDKLARTGRVSDAAALLEKLLPD